MTTGNDTPIVKPWRPAVAADDDSLMFCQSLGVAGNPYPAITHSQGVLGGIYSHSLTKESVDLKCSSQYSEFS